MTQSGWLFVLFICCFWFSGEKHGQFLSYLFFCGWCGYFILLDFNVTLFTWIYFVIVGGCSLVRFAALFNAGCSLKDKVSMCF